MNGFWQEGETGADGGLGEGEAIVDTTAGWSTTAPGKVATAKTVDAAQWFATLSNTMVVSKKAEALTPKGHLILR
jgi:hypothetical protein